MGWEMMGWWKVAALSLLDLALWGIIASEPRPRAADRRLWDLVSRRRSAGRPERALPAKRLGRLAVRGVAAGLRRITSSARRRRTADLLARAGIEWEPVLYDAMKLAGGISAAFAAGMAGGLGVLPGGALRWALLAGGAGYLVPMLWMRTRAIERARAFRKVLPDALDVIAICLRGGFSFQAAVAEYAGNASGAGGEAFRRYLTDLALGQTTEAGLMEMARRYPSDDLAVVSAGLIQGVRLGSPLADVFEEQASHFRAMALRRAEEGARALSTRLVLPLVAFIFPQVFLIGLGPVALRLLGPGGLLR